eukprot:COSAG06_NODE_5871_length_3234_cov_1.776467_6_plen_39_part_00
MYTCMIYIGLYIYIYMEKTMVQTRFSNPLCWINERGHV